jgi:hypothetical protein
MSLVPMVRVPLNIMCSKKWLSPVMPGRSFTDPTCATQPAAIVGDSWVSNSSQRIPLGSVSSCTLICGFSAAASGTAVKNARTSGTTRKRREVFIVLDSLENGETAER